MSESGTIAAEPPEAFIGAGPSATRQVSAAQPVCFGQTVGLFTAAAGVSSRNDVAVLFASPWGLEDLSARKFFRIIADALAEIGVPSLRFDYPGTGDALDPPDHEAGLSIYEDTLLTAAAALRQLSGRARIVIVGQGLGSVLALRADRIRADGVALIAPFNSGRTYLRELALWAKVVDESLALAEEHRIGAGVAIAGFVMPPSIAAQVGKINLSSLPGWLPASVLITERPGRPGDGELAERLQAAGAAVARVAFDGYDALVSNPTLSIIPHDLVRDIVEWVAAIRPDARPAEPVHSPVPILSGALTSRFFRETPVRFGEADRLYGILCEPLGPPRGATVVLLSSAYDRHSGWGGLTVRTARRLAEAGISSFRFDGANVADSPPLAGAPDQVLYTDTQMRDARAALEFIAERGLLPSVVYGRCSGAHLAYQTAVADGRWGGVVSVNPPAFYWDPGIDVRDVLKAVPKPLGTYARRPFQLETYKRLFDGSLNVAQALRNILSALSTRARLVLGSSGRRNEKYQIVDRGFKTLSSRAQPFEILYSEDDPGHLEYLLQFGNETPTGRRYPNVNVTMMPRTDHNVTPEASRTRVFETLLETALSVGKRK
jgi:alpha-beta hydrolase superfamily lysophospholipase